MTQFRQETTDAGTETAAKFKQLIGQARIDDDEIEIGADAPQPSEHALAYYQFACDIDDGELQDLWYDALEGAHRQLNDMGVVDALDDLEIQGIQTVIFGFEIMHRFAGRIGADRDALPDRDELDDAIAYVVERIGPGGKRKSHADRFVELFANAAAAGDYLERGTHYELVKEGNADEELRVHLSRTYDALSKYAADHDIDRSDLLNSHLDYRDRFDDMADDPGSYVTDTVIYTPSMSNCTGFKTTMLVDALEFDRNVLETDERLPDDATSTGSSDDDDDSGPDLTDDPDAELQPIAEIEPTQLLASTSGRIEVQESDGVGSGNGPFFSVHLTDDSGTAELIAWDADDLPPIFDGGSIEPDALLVRNAQPQAPFDDDDAVQLVIGPDTAVEPAQPGAATMSPDDPGANADLSASTDGGTDEITNADLDKQIELQTLANRDGDGADRDAVATAVSNELDVAVDRVDDRIDQLLASGNVIFESTPGSLNPIR